MKSGQLHECTNINTTVAQRSFVTFNKPEPSLLIDPQTEELQFGFERQRWMNNGWAALQAILNINDALIYG